MVTGISFPYIEAGCPSASPQNSAEAAVWGQQKSQPGANTAENVCHDMPQPCEGCRGAGTACFLLLSWRSNLSLDLQEEVRLVGFSQPLCYQSTNSQEVWQVGLGGREIRKSMSGIIRVFHLRIHSETACRHLYTSHCILHGCTYCYKPFIVSRVSLLPKCCLQSLPFPAKPRCQCVLGTGDY